MTKFVAPMVLDGALKKTEDGWVTQARVARAGNVQLYRGSEFGIKDRAVIRVYRPEEEVFSKDAVQSYARKPITVNHPAKGVDATTWKEHAVGEIDSTVVRDGEFISVPLLIRDAAAAEIVSSGKARELSMGYDMTLTMDAGISPSGEEYDAVARDFRMNHVAIVPVARGGSELRIGDADPGNWGAVPVKDGEIPMQTRTVVVGDAAFNVNDDGFAAIEALKKIVASKDAALTEKDTAHNAVVVTKDTEIGELKGKLKTAEDAAMTPEKLAKAVADRMTLVAAVKGLDAKAETDGKTDEELKKEAVEKKLGKDAVADASPAEINGMFKAIAKAAADAKPKDPVLDALRKPAGDGNTVQVGDADSEYNKMRARDSAAWEMKEVRQ